MASGNRKCNKKYPVQVPTFVISHRRGSYAVAKCLDLKVHDDIANREYSPKASAERHRPPIVFIHGPIC